MGVSPDGNPSRPWDLTTFFRTPEHWETHRSCTSWMLGSSTFCIAWLGSMTSNFGVKDSSYIQTCHYFTHDSKHKIEQISKSSSTDNDSRSRISCIIFCSELCSETLRLSLRSDLSLTPDLLYASASATNLNRLLIAIKHDVTTFYRYWE